MFKLTLLVLLGLLADGVTGARILISPLQGKSHMISANAIGQELKSQGHEVYTLAEDIFKAGSVNKIGAAGLEVLYYHVREGTQYIDSQDSQEKIVKMILREKPEFVLVSNCLMDSCRNLYSDDEVMKKIGELKFDLAIIQAMPFVQCNYLLPHIFNIPHVTFLPGYFNFLVGGAADLPSFLPHLGSVVPSSLPMNFFERLKNTFMHIVTKREIFPFLMSDKVTGMIPDISDLSLIEEYRQKGMVKENIQNWFDIVDETQLFILVNSGTTFDHPKPLYPNVVSVEGLTVAEINPLPEDLEKLVQSSEHGVVVVSFGSNVQYLPDEIIVKLVNIFGKRKELFLMRFQGEIKDKTFKLPSNVKLMTWLPQKDLLGHNKTKLFITHGGMYGLHEAVYQGIPLLCVPLFADQPTNAQILETKGYGLQFRLMSFTEEEILGKIEELLTNPSYRQKTQRAGDIMRHKPMNARQTAAFWIEHVLRFGGEHLKPSSAELYWWQYFCLDTLGFMLLIGVSILYFVYSLLKFIFKFIFVAKPHTKKD